VIATQNPAHQVGTFPLPESQLDRFLMCLSLGYPDASAERALLMGEDRRAMLKTLQPVMRPEELLDAQRSLRAIHASGALIDYLQALAQESRSGKLFAEGLSPRATLALLQAARAWAALEGRDHVIPEDIQALLVPVCAHRLRPLKSAQGGAPAATWCCSCRNRCRSDMADAAVADYRSAAAGWLRGRRSTWRERTTARDRGEVELNQRRVYILPTRAGLGFGALLLALLIGSINYNLGLGFGLTFVAAACALVDMVPPTRNLAHLRLRPGRAPAVFAGEEAPFELLLSNRTRLARYASGSISSTCPRSRAMRSTSRPAAAPRVLRRHQRGAAG
jgi:GNAT superfamily N-acetyltransferase